MTGKEEKAKMEKEKDIREREKERASRVHVGPATKSGTGPRIALRRRPT